LCWRRAPGTACLTFPGHRGPPRVNSRRDHEQIQKATQHLGRNSRSWPRGARASARRGESPGSPSDTCHHLASDRRQNTYQMKWFWSLFGAITLAIDPRKRPVPPRPGGPSCPRNAPNLAVNRRRATPPAPPAIAERPPPARYAATVKMRPGDRRRRRSDKTLEAQLVASSLRDRALSQPTPTPSSNSEPQPAHHRHPPQQSYAALGTELSIESKPGDRGQAGPGIPRPTRQAGAYAPFVRRLRAGLARQGPHKPRFQPQPRPIPPPSREL